MKPGPNIGYAAKGIALTAKDSHFVYALVARESGHFAEMAAVSATTLRRVMPSARITFLTDEETADLSTPAMAILRTLATDWVVSPTGDLPPAMASRMLKLTCRNIIEGDFIFIDCDTLVARDLSGLIDHCGDFAVVKDLPALPDHIRAFADEAGLVVPCRYFNSGIMAMRDAPALRAAFSNAHETWRRHHERGFYFDQVFLNSALHGSDIEITWLSPSFNAQIWAKTYHAIRPHIFHIFSGNFEERNETVLHVLAKKLKQTGVLDVRVIDLFLESGNPWNTLSRPGQYIALGRPIAALASTMRLAFGGR